ncbi:hypothetical protein [Mechercharimyces sp. CAU 1602]|uniref:hypothetical protein n=1 Tax=Mechercharimyces sp. CAU 1602 TaxID=2973933 RepID=UPI0021610C07|nr:hypothetical protein [Mechercharimyces sp. CAU 1602]MCS1350185.1 hypothetical protein [Mechercharimyces sp. CAU 1602]
MGFFDELKNKVGKGVETTGQRSRRVLEASKLSMNIRRKEEDIKRYYHRLGVATLQAWDKEWAVHEDPNVKETVKALQMLHKQKEELEQERLSLQDKIPCPGCGEWVEHERDACPACGQLMPITNLDVEAEPTQEVELEVSSAPPISPQPERITIQDERPPESTVTTAVSSASPPTQVETNVERTPVKSVTPTKAQPVKEEQKAQEGATMVICPYCAGLVGEEDQACPHCASSF